MLLFIVPLISPEVCKDWAVASGLCNRTLCSLAQQTTSDFRIILVCDALPNDMPSLPQLTVFQRLFRVPNPERVGSRMWNKREKLKAGLWRARDFKADFIMFVDSDDCVSRHLCEFIHDIDVEHGFVIRNGYTYVEDSPWLYARPGFNQMCASSIILKYRWEELPKSLDECADNFRLLQGHNEISVDMAAHNQPLAEIPFRAAVYILGHGENAVGQTQMRPLARLLRARPLTMRRRREFGIYSLAAGVSQRT